MLPLERLNGVEEVKVHGVCRWADEWWMGLCSLGSVYFCGMGVGEQSGNMCMLGLAHSMLINFMEIVRGIDKKG